MEYTTSKNYKVSIIIPTYNAGRYLKRCILSALDAQSIGEQEIIIINDGSTDNTVRVLGNLTKHIIKSTSEIPSTIQIIHQQNKGAGYARNVGLSKASGDYIIFLDADDRLVKYSIDKMIERMREDDTDICLGKIRYVVAGIPVGSSIGFWRDMKTRTVDMSNRNSIVEVSTGIGAKIFKSTLFEDFMFPTGIKWEDMPLVLTLLAKAERISLLHEDVYDYNMHLNTTIKDFLFENNVFDIITGMDMLKENLSRLGLYDKYEQDYLSALTLHTMFRAQNVLTWINVGRAKKKEIISELLSSLEARHPNWENDSVLCDATYRYKDPFFNFLQRRLPM